MKLFILGDEMGATTSNSRMAQIYPGWQDTKNFAKDILKDTMNEERRDGARDPWSNLNFDIVTKSVEEIAEQYGRFQDGECRAMKNDLVQLGDRNIGRVPLSEFYRPALEGKSWQFMESVDYLRSLGALDETDPNLPSVIVPNYVGSQSNCVVSTSYYSVCCMDECEGLTSQLEKEFASPEADPKEVLAVVSGLSSSTVPGPRELSAPLVRRLEDIAEGHHGTVQLHGRLFGQWMHHAFPRECPFPHVAGSTNPQTPDEWMTEGAQSFASKAEMRRYADQADSKETENQAPTELHWIHMEELLVPFPAKPAPAQRSKFWLFTSVLMLSAVFCSVASQAIAPVQAATSALKKSMGVSDEIKGIKEGLSWTEPATQGSMMRLRSRGDRSFLPA